MESLEAAIDAVIEKLEHALAARLTSLGDREALAIYDDIVAAKRTRKHLPGVGDFSPPSFVYPQATTQNGNGNGHRYIYAKPAKADTVIEIIRSAGRPMHVSEIHEQLPEYGIQLQKNTLTSMLNKDRRGRFIRVDPNTFALNEEAIAATVEARIDSLRGGFHTFFPDGFSLVKSVKAILPEFEGEFTRPMVMDKLKEKYPDLADRFQGASVSTTLTTLENRGVVEVTDPGRGNVPRTYKLKESV